MSWEMHRAGGLKIHGFDVFSFISFFLALPILPQGLGVYGILGFWVSDTRRKPAKEKAFFLIELSISNAWHMFELNGILSEYDMGR